MTDDDSLDDVWDRIGGPAEGAADSAAEPQESDVVPDDIPPVAVSVVLKSDKVPVAPWAQGWQIGAMGPHDGRVTLICQHELGDSPVAQLSAVAGLLSTIKQAKLEIEQWAIQTHGPVEAAQVDPDDEFRDLLGGE